MNARENNPNTTEAANRAEAIRLSLRSFVLGLLALVPMVGLVCGLSSFLDHLAARRASQGTWNPAERYRLAGGVLGLLGFSLSVVLLLGVGGVILMNLN